MTKTVFFSVDFTTHLKEDRLKWHAMFRPFTNFFHPGLYYKFIHESSFISKQFLVLNVNCGFGLLCNIFFCYVNIILLNLLKSLIIGCPFSGDICLSFGVSLWNTVFFISLSTVSERFCGELLDTFVILWAILLPSKSSGSSAVFWTASFGAALSSTVIDFSAWLRKFCLYLPLTFYLNFTNIFSHIFIKRQKSVTFYKYSISRLNWITSHFYTGWPTKMSLF